MIRAGLVGFGMAGRVFHGPLLSSVDGLELSAVVERHSDNAVARYPGITTYRSLDALLADDSIDLIVIATPSGSHFELVKRTLEAGKSVVVDKPACTTAAEIATLIELADQHNLLLAPFQNRRWDSDFQTIQKLLLEDSLGRLVSFESNFYRWRPVPKPAWKESTRLGGGALLDLGTHLVDQALMLFGKPEAVSAEVLRERDQTEDGTGAEDAFTVRLFYPQLTVTLGSNCLTTGTGLRFHLRGTKGNFYKWGLDPQEARLNQIRRIEEADWGTESASNWGTLSVDVEGGMVDRPVKSIPGDYRQYYAGVRDALLGKSELPVTALEAWRTAKVLELALASAEQQRVLACDGDDEPETPGSVINR